MKASRTLATNLEEDVTATLLAHNPQAQDSPVEILGGVEAINVNGGFDDGLGLRRTIRRRRTEGRCTVPGLLAKAVLEFAGGASAVPGEAGGVLPPTRVRCRGRVVRDGAKGALANRELG